MKQYVKVLSDKGRVIYNSYVSALRNRAGYKFTDGISCIDFRNDEYWRLTGFCSGISYALGTYEEAKAVEDALFEEFYRTTKHYKRCEENGTEIKRAVCISA